jgi:hypothetical protein
MALDDLHASIREVGPKWDGTMGSLFAGLLSAGVQPHERVALEIGFGLEQSGRLSIERGHDSAWEVRIK